jgi:predicted phosphate transport protein (TIGR00153 family)
MAFAWFQRMLPRQGNFFALFEAHAASIVGAADALSHMIEGGPGTGVHIAEIHKREHDADDVTREVLQTVRRTFLTPFDRGAITSLIAAMDDAVDEMHAAAAAVDLYDLRVFEPEMKEMVTIIVDAARLTAEAMPLLRDVARNHAALHKLTERLVRLEGEADGVHTRGLKSAFERDAKTDTLSFIVAREIYKHLERIADSFEDVANEIDGIVIDHA